VFEGNAVLTTRHEEAAMRFMVYAVKAMLNEDLKQRERGAVRRPRRRRAAVEPTPQALVRPTASAEPATRGATLATPRPASNAG
jgi:hypothetical protein